MTEAIALNMKGSSGTTSVVGIAIDAPFSATQLGGVLNRVPKVNNGQWAMRRCMMFKNDMYVLDTRPNVIARVYKRIISTATNEVRLLRLTGNPTPSLPTAGSTVTGDTSSATGVMVENYITGDNFLILEMVSGTFQNNETLTISGGISAQITASNGVENNGSEYYVVFTSAFTVHNSSTGLGTGFVPYVRSDKTLGIAFLFNNTLANGIGVTSPDGVTWTEGSVGSWGDSGGTPVQSNSATINGLVYHAQTNGVNSATLRSWNPSTGAFTSTTLSSTSIVGNIIDFDGRACITVPSGASTFLYDVTGGTVNYTVFTAASPSGGIAQSYIMYRGINEESYYIGYRTTANKVVLQRLILLSGVVTWNGSAAWEPTNGIGEKMLPTALLSTITTPRRGIEFDDTQDSPGSETTRLSFYTETAFYSVTASFTQYTISDAWSNLVSGASVTWNGTIGTATDVVFPSDPGLAVGDWIRHADSNKAFRVTAIAGGSNENITIANDSSLASVPNTASVTQKAIQSWNLVGGAVSGCDIPSTRSGGGGYLYTDGQIYVEIVDSEPVIGGERLYFVAYSPSGAETVDVTFYYKDQGETITQPTIAASSAGSIVGNAITGLTADNTTVIYADISSPPTGFQNRIPNIEVSP